MDKKIQNDPDMLFELSLLIGLIWVVSTIAVAFVAACWNTDFTQTTFVVVCGLAIITTVAVVSMLAPLCILRMNPLECVIIVDELYKKQYFYSKAGAIFILPWMKEYKRISLHKQLIVTSGGDPLDGTEAYEKYPTKEEGNAYTKYTFVLVPDVYNLPTALVYLNTSDASRAEIFRKKATQFFSDRVGNGSKLDDLIQSKDTISDDFAKTFNPKIDGGVDEEMCKRYAVTVVSANLSELIPSPEISAAREKETIANAEANASTAYFQKLKGSGLNLTTEELGLAVYRDNPENFRILQVVGAPGLKAIGEGAGVILGDDRGGSDNNNRRPKNQKPKAGGNQ